MRLKTPFTNEKIYSIEVRNLLRLSVPITINRSSNQVAITILVAFLGLSNTEDLASFSLAISLMAVLFSFASIIVVGVQNLSAKSFKNDYEDLISTFRSGLLISLIVGCILFLISRIGVNPFDAISENGNLSQNSYEIYLLLAISLPIMSMTSCFGFYLEGTGRAKLTSIVTTTISFAKIILAYILILDPFYLHFGAAEGAAISIVLSDFLALMFFIFYIIKNDGVLSYDFFKIKKQDLKAIKLILKIGVPSAFGFCLQKLAFAIIAFFIASFGESYIAAYTIIFNIVSLFAMPVVGVAHSNSILASASIGAGDEESTIKTYSSSLKLASLYALLFFIIYVIYGQSIAAIFSDDLIVLNVIDSSLTGAIMLFLGHSFFSISISYLRSFSDTLKPQAITSLFLYIIATPILFAYPILFIPPNLNVMIFILGLVLASLFIVLHFRSVHLCDNYFASMEAAF